MFSTLTPALLKSSLVIAERYGHFAVLAGCVLGLIVAIINASKTSSLSSFFVGGVAFVVAIAVAQYSAMRFMNAGASLIALRHTMHIIRQGEHEAERAKKDLVEANLGWLSR